MPSTRDIQQRLTALGFDPGPADNNAGPRTEAAIKRFQTSRALVADGIVGPLTEAALWPEAAGEPLSMAETVLGKMTPPALTVSAAGRGAISQREGLRLKAYRDSVGILTIGVGHTSAAGPPKVTAGMEITAAECDAILSRDLAKFEEAVHDSVSVPMSQNEFDALVSLAFNIGGGAFQRSSVAKRLNAGNRQRAADAFLLWNKAGGRVLPGLTKRRQAERAQFLG